MNEKTTIADPIGQAAAYVSRAKDAQEREKARAEGKEGTRHGFRFMRASELEASAPAWTIKNVWEVDTLGGMFGEPGAFKSFMELDQACCIAAGIPWHGNAVKQGAVIIIAGEGLRGLLRRFAAWCKIHDADPSALPVYFSTGAACLTDPDNVDAVMAAVMDIVETVGPPAVVYVDTLARNLGGDENSALDMSAFVQALDRIKAAWHCTVVVVHHSGHMEKDRSRGHSSFKAALDTEYRLDKDDQGVCRVVCTKSKDAAPPEPMAFRLRQVDIGIVDDDGNPVTSAVLEPCPYEPPAAPGKAGRGRWQTVGIQVLEELEERAARRAETLGQDPEAVRIPVDDWKAACTGAGMPRRTVYKVQETLTELSLIFLDHGYLSSEPSMCPCAPSIEGAQTAHRNTAEGHKVHANGTANGTQRAQPEEADGDVIE